MILTEISLSVEGITEEITRTLAHIATRPDTDLEQYRAITVCRKDFPFLRQMVAETAGEISFALPKFYTEVSIEETQVKFIFKQEKISFNRDNALTLLLRKLLVYGVVRRWLTLMTLYNSSFYDQEYTRGLETLRSRLGSEVHSPLSRRFPPFP